MEKWKLGVGAAHEFEILANKVGWTNVDFSRLTSDEALNRKVLAVLRGQAEISEPVHLIDCDAPPFVPKSWSVEEHVKGGTLAWDASKVRLPLGEGQRRPNYIVNDTLRMILKRQPILNANVLDYLLANPHIIPEEWKGKMVFFWGTIYRGADGRLYVRQLRWNDRGYWHNGWLGFDWSSGLPTSHFASWSFVLAAHDVRGLFYIRNHLT